LGTQGTLAELVSEALGEFRKDGHLLGVWPFVHAVNGRDSVVFERTRHRFVGGQHEYFDDAVGHQAWRSLDARHFTRFVKEHLSFGEVEINGTTLYPFAIQYKREFLHQLEALHKRDITLTLLYVAI